MPQGHRRHKKESRGFKPWQAIRWDKEPKRDTPPPIRNITPRKRSKVEPVDPAKVDKSYRASLELLVRESSSEVQSRPDFANRIHGFRRQRSRVPAIPTIRQCDGARHIWRDAQCSHANGRTVIVCKCRDCGAPKEIVIETPVVEEHVWVNICRGSGCDLKALDGDDFCAFHEMEQGTECAPELRLPMNLGLYGMTMKTLPAIREQEWVIKPEDRAFQILGPQEGARVVTSETLKDLRERLIQEVTKGRGEIDWNAKPDYSTLRRASLV